MTSLGFFQMSPQFLRSGPTATEAYHRSWKLFRNVHHVPLGITAWAPTRQGACGERRTTWEGGRQGHWPGYRWRFCSCRNELKNILPLLLSGWLPSLNPQMACAGKVVEKRGACPLLVRMQSGAATWKAVWSFLSQLNVELPSDPAIPCLGIYLKPYKTLIQRNM